MIMFNWIELISCSDSQLLNFQIIQDLCIMTMSIWNIDMHDITNNHLTPYSYEGIKKSLQKLSEQMRWYFLFVDNHNTSKTKFVKNASV